MRLSDAKQGELLRVVGFEEGCDEFKCKLQSMGFQKGDVVRVLSKGFFGPIQVEVNKAKIALCRGQAKKIEVEPI